MAIRQSPDFIPLPYTATTPQQCGSFLTAIAVIINAGDAEATLRLWDVAQHHLTLKGEANEFSIDDLSPARTAELAQQQILTSTEWQDLPAGHDGTRARLELLRHLRTDPPSELNQRVKRVAREHVGKGLAAQERRLEAQLEQNYQRASAQVTLFQDMLNSIVYPTPHFEAMAHLANAVEACDHLRRDGRLDALRRDRYLDKLEQSIPPLLEKSAQAVSLQASNAAVKEEVGALQPRLEAHAERAALCGRRLAEVRERLSALLDESRAAQVDTETAIYLRLTGKTAEQHLAAATTFFGANDQQELAQATLEQFRASLESTARKQYSHIRQGARLSDYFVHLTADALVADFVPVARRCFRDDFSIYTAAKSFGIERLARQLMDLAQPPVDLDGRDAPQLNVDPNDVSFVILPRPVSQFDLEAQAALKRACARIHSRSQFLDAPPDESRIVVIRFLVGFPPQLMADNWTLLMSYAQSTRNFHTPHLVGFHGDSQAGQAITGLVDLARQYEEESDS